MKIQTTTIIKQISLKEIRGMIAIPKGTWLSRYHFQWCQFRFEQAPVDFLLVPGPLLDVIVCLPALVAARPRGEVRVGLNDMIFEPIIK